MSELNVSRITDISTNPTDDSSHPTAISMTTQQSYPKEKEPWLDLSFLGDRQCTEKDFLCNYWRHTVADGETMRFDYFLDVMDAQERELWQGFSNDFVPSWAKFMEVCQGGEGDDNRSYILVDGCGLGEDLDDFSIEDEV